MDYQIIATLGPGSNSESIWERMLQAGVTGFRVNTCHLSLPRLEAWIERLGTFLVPQNPRPALVLDLQGSKWRLGQFPAFDLAEGQEVRLVCAASAEAPNVIPVPHPDFFQAASLSSAEIVLNDGRIRFRLESRAGNSLIARVVAGGPILPQKGITYTASTYRQERLSETDRTILDRTHGTEGIRYALSYVKDADEMAHYRALIGASAYLIGKVERQPAVDETIEIAASAEEIWLCRGDLGAELGERGMAVSAHRFSERVARVPVPVLLAGQVLEHMTEHPAPTRSEVCQMYDALKRGYQGFVLSDETAIGRYPVESCRIAALFR